MGFFSRHRKAFKSVIASFGMLFGLLAGVSVTANVAYAGISGYLNDSLTSLLTVTATNDGEWSVNDREMTGTVTGSKTLWWDNEEKTTVTLLNKSTETIELAFSWTLTVPSSMGSATIDGQSYTVNQSSVSFQKEIASKSSIDIKIAASGKGNTTRIQIADISAIVVKKSSVTFKKAESGGHYFVNDVLVDDKFQQFGEKLSTTAYSLKAVPDSGFEFIGWQTTIEGVSKIVSIENPYEFKSDVNCELTAVFKKGQNLALFSNDSRYFGDLDEAISHANTATDKVVRLLKSGNVMPKADRTPYVFSHEVKLFVPGSTASAFLDYANKHPAEGTSGGYTCDMKMQLTDGVTLEFESGSKLVIGGDMWYATGGNLTSLPVGKIGEIILSVGSAVNLRAGSEFYCWGYASGEGEIHAFNGSNVYEGFSFYFRGGKALSKIYGKAFLFNQYYVQNIECALHLHYGSTDTVSFRISYKPLITQQYKSESFVFIGANGMFALKENATLIKKYNREQDRMEYRVVGNGTLSHIQVTVAGNTVDSADYILPMNNNMDISVESGELTLEQNVEFLPEATLTVNNGATVVIGSNRTMLFYDLSNWKGKKYASGSDIVPINYVSPYSKQKGYLKRSDATIKNGAKLVLNGEIKNSGTILSTNPENATQDVSEIAKVVSDGGGKMLFLGKAYDSNETITAKFKQPQNNGDPVEIGSKPMIFANSDNSIYSGTCPVGSALVHENGFWNAQEQGPRNITITFKNADATAVLGTKTYTISGNAGIELPDQTEFANFQGTIFLWLEESDNTRCYEPNTNIKTIQTHTVLIAFIGGWYTDLNKDTYYYDRDTGKTKGLKYIYEEGTWPEDLYCFDENGILLKSEGQIFSYEQGTKYDNTGDGNIYYVNNGVVQNGKGFVKRDAIAGEGETHYYYFGPAHYAYRNTTCYIDTNLNNLLPAGVYTFGNDGRVEVLECSNFAGIDSVTLSADGYCTFGTIKAGIGLFTSGTHIYYAKDDGSIMRGGTYYVEEGKLNGKATNAGLYYFDANGYLCDSMMNPIEVTPPEANA